MKLRTDKIYIYNHMPVIFEYMLNNGRAAVMTFDENGERVYLSANPAAMRISE